MHGSSPKTDEPTAVTAGLRKLLEDLADTFWLVPGALVAAGAIMALLLVELDRTDIVVDASSNTTWIYGGGTTGARSLLEAIASSTITVAGTVFSIMIAALTLAAGQMGPRLLRNFTRDRGNQLTLGIFLATFVYALLVLRSVRSEDEGGFVPQLAVSAAIGLAMICVAALVWFVGHMAGRISVDTVIALVSDELERTIRRLTHHTAPPAPPPEALWRSAQPICDNRRGYLVQLDDAALADWAVENRTAIRLLKRPGDFLFPGTPIALALPPVEGIEDAIRDATAVGPKRTTSADIELAVRQLVEVALRALSPGINDPFTAITVLDELGAALCEVATLHLPTGVIERDGRPVIVASSVDYDGLADAMLHSIRQSGAANAPVVIRLLEVLAEVASAESNPSRWRTLARHADLVLTDAERSIASEADLSVVRERHACVRAAMNRLHAPKAPAMIASETDES
jgi:uncharacterized membrane protein